MAYLILENGLCFEGQRIGADKESTGELVFTTGVVGYLETLTDAGFAGQIVVQTFPLIGNYGVIEEDLEGKCALAGYIVRELCDYPSNFRSQYELDTFLKNNGICGLCGIDTRELTRTLREEGSMNACICDELPSDLTFIKEHTVKGIIKQVSCEKSYTVTSAESKYNITLIDYGVRKSLINVLNELGCNVKVVPYNTSAEEILGDCPDGIVLSGGTESVIEENECIDTVKSLIGKVPVLAIGTGHVLASLALGAKAEKLACGHRGSNIPVKLSDGTNKTHITSQNHGYAVLSDTLCECADKIFANANDNTCEGVIYTDKNCISVQFYPDTVIASNNTSFIYSEFIDMMGGSKNA